MIFGKIAVFPVSTIRCCVRAEILSGFPGSSFRRPVCTASTRFWPRLWRRVKDNAPYHRFGPLVGARCRPPKSKINLLSANGYSPSTENGGIVPYHDMSRNRSGKMKTSNMANLLWGTASQNSTFDSSRDFSPAALREKYAFGEPSLQGGYPSTRSRSMRQRKNIAGG